MAGVKGKRRKTGRKDRPDNPAQSKRFIEEARKLGVDESGEAFRKVMDGLLKPKGSRVATARNARDLERVIKEAKEWAKMAQETARMVRKETEETIRTARLALKLSRQKP